MALNSKQPRWDIYEAVILLEGYLETLQGIQSKSKIIKRTSADLRRMAVNRGVEIDDVYRNENGISYQIQSMDSAFKGQKVYAPTTKLFTDAVTLYRADNERYQKILGEAKGMIGVDVPQKAVASLGSENKETADSAEADSKLVVVLKQHYKYGFKYDSIRELMRFRQFADAMDIELTEDDEALKAAILACGTVIDDKVYCKSDDMPKELQKIIDEAFASGACVIY